MKLTIFPIAQREMLVASRSLKTYRVRVAAVLMGILVCFCCLEVVAWFGGPSMRGAELFMALVWITYVFCLVGGAALTVDSISDEKRDGTLGLLFLTDLKGYDIVIGKLAAVSLNCFYGLIGMMPILALPMMMGGVALAELGRVGLALAATLILSLSVGLLISAFSKRATHAMGAVLFFMILWGASLPGISELLRVHYKRPELAFYVDLISPSYLLRMSFQNIWGFPSNRYWTALGLLVSTSVLFLCVAAWWVPRSWQDKVPKPARARWNEGWRKLIYGSAGQRRSLRCRLLNQNPFCWLAARERISSFGFLTSIGGLGLLGGWLVRRDWKVTDPTGQYVIPMIVWMALAGFLHLVLLARIPTVASVRLAEDRASGALELIASTSLTVREIVRGQWIALVRQMSGPILAVLFLHFLGMCWFFTAMKFFSGIHWLDAIMGTFGYIMTGQIPSGGDENIPIISFLVFTAMLPLLWLALSWCSMWIALKINKPAHVPGNAFLLVVLPPGILLSLIMGLLEFIDAKVLEVRFGGDLFVLGLSSGIYSIHCVLTLFFSRWRFYREFRIAAADRFQPPGSRLRWWKSRLV